MRSDKYTYSFMAGEGDYRRVYSADGYDAQHRLAVLLREELSGKKRVSSVTRHIRVANVSMTLFFVLVEWPANKPEKTA